MSQQELFSEPNQIDFGRYRVLTWCPTEHKFTPQDDVPAVAVGFGGLRRAIRRLREMGYSAEYSSLAGGGYGDPAVSIERIEE